MTAPMPGINPSAITNAVGGDTSLTCNAIGVTVRFGSARRLEAALPRLEALGYLAFRADETHLCVVGWHPGRLRDHIDALAELITRYSRAADGYASAALEAFLTRRDDPGTPQERARELAITDAAIAQSRRLFDGLQMLLAPDLDDLPADPVEAGLMRQVWVLETALRSLTDDLEKAVPAAAIDSFLRHEADGDDLLQARHRTLRTIRRTYRAGPLPNLVAADELQRGDRITGWRYQDGTICMLSKGAAVTVKHVQYLGEGRGHSIAPAAVDPVDIVVGTLYVSDTTRMWRLPRG